ncbi:hypothetical protein E6O75_ATG07165 [Venturia nashicola]|uniref:Uncharacterized protein n=1 Tax=Venturia nashicola TaxID=86259 RepID=A0A4Z1NTF3_9PEZI|nr:hypothetical protein E6O75_ATG07165 [Venturia nashicola]
MLHLTETTISTILSLYRRHKVRNVSAIHAILSIHNPSLAAYPNNANASDFEIEHLQDLIPPHQYNKIVASAGHTRKCRDRVPSDKEKIIDVLNRGKCRDYVDEVLTRDEVRMLRTVGVKVLGGFEGRDSLVGANRVGEKDIDVEARNEELGLQESRNSRDRKKDLGLETPFRDKDVILVESSPSGAQARDERLGLQTPGPDREVILKEFLSMTRS